VKCCPFRYCFAQTPDGQPKSKTLCHYTDDKYMDVKVQGFKTLKPFVSQTQPICSMLQPLEFVVFSWHIACASARLLTRCCR
jgi:hypothetical protein